MRPKNRYLVIKWRLQSAVSLSCSCQLRGANISHNYLGHTTQTQKGATKCKRSNVYSLHCQRRWLSGRWGLLWPVSVCRVGRGRVSGERSLHQLNSNQAKYPLTSHFLLTLVWVSHIPVSAASVLFIVIVNWWRLSHNVCSAARGHFTGLSVFMLDVLMSRR